MTITYHGIANAGGNDDSTLSVTPPASMTTGMLCVLIGHMADPPAGAFSIGNTGGQTWNDLGSDDGSNNDRFHVWWAVYDGTWDADPSITFPAQGGNNAVQTTLIVFTDSAGGTFGVDVAISWGNDATAPYTITGPTPTTADPTVAVAGWGAVSDATWNTLSGTGWSQAGSTSGYQSNVGGSDDSTVVFAYDPSESTSTLANVEQSGGASAHTFVVVFSATPVVNFQINFSQANLEISSSAPDADITHSATFGQADLQINSFAPAAGVSHSSDFGKSDLQIGAFAPSITLSEIVELAQSNLEISTSAPTVGLTHSATLSQSNLQINASAPTVSQTDNISLVQSNLEIGSFAPTVGVDIPLSLDQSNLEISTSAPTVAASAFAYVRVTWVRVSAGVASDVTNFPISLIQSDLQIGSFAPTVGLTHSATFGQGNLQIGSFAPTAGISHSASFGQSNLEISTFAPTVVYDESVGFSSADLEISSFSPTVSVSAIVSAAANKHWNLRSGWGGQAIGAGRSGYTR